MAKRTSNPSEQQDKRDSVSDTGDPAEDATSTASSDGRTRWLAALVRPIQEFLRLEAASGVLLLLAAVCALLWANIDEDSYVRVVKHVFAFGAGGHDVHFSVEETINDGLMTLFFFVVGLEIKRELVVGELDTLPKATLPAIAAIGGMIVPAAIFAAFNWNSVGRHGWGIPMATDIAFCAGVLRLLRRHVARPLVIFVTALAIFDDIGGILVIAVFYGAGLDLVWLVAAAGASFLLWIFHRRHVRRGLAYAIAGTALWYALHRSGIHATIAGVVTGLMVPARSPRSSAAIDEEPSNAHASSTAPQNDADATLEGFLHRLHPFVAYFVMPIFALANSGVSLRGAGARVLAPVALGTALGLFAGKQLGIYTAAALAVRLRFAPMPGGAGRAELYGVSIVAGIGFTVALFIATLAFRDAPDLLADAKVGILLGSLASGIVGTALLRFVASTKRSCYSPRATSEPPPPIAPARESRRP